MEEGRETEMAIEGGRAGGRSEGMRLGDTELPGSTAGLRRERGTSGYGEPPVGWVKERH